MKLFVWTEVLCNYTCGMVVALAPDLETALPLIEDAIGYPAELPSSRLTVIDLASVMVEPQAWATHGGA